MTKRWWALTLVPGLVVARALRVRLTVGPRRRYWATRASQGDQLLVALGDSLTQGIGSSSPTTSWLALYAAHLESVTGRSVRVENRAVYAAKIADLIATQFPLPPDATTVVLCIGANDAGRTSPDDFRRRLRIVCAQLPPGSVVGDVPEFQWGGRVEAAAELAQVVRDVVAEHPELRLARVESHTAGTKIFTELAGDFFHPGDVAYGRIAEAFVEAAVAPRVSAPVDSQQSVPVR